MNTPLPGVAPAITLQDQLAALAEEIPHMVKRQEIRADKGKVHWATAGKRIRELKAAQLTLQDLIKTLLPESPREALKAELERRIQAQQPHPPSTPKVTP